MRHVLRVVVLRFSLVIAMCAPLSASTLRAQDPQPPSRVERTLKRLSHYAGWGMVIGAGAGLVYGLIAEESDSRRGVDIVGDVAIGAGAGLAIGALVYVIKSAQVRHSKGIEVTQFRAIPMAPSRPNVTSTTPFPRLQLPHLAFQ